MRAFLRSLFGRRDEAAVQQINALRTQFLTLNDKDLDAAAVQASTLFGVVAVAAVIASRELGQDMFDVQLLGSLALANGRIAEMQTGEGKTLSAVPAVIWYAKQGLPVHVLTVNDYLVKRDASWMGPIYQRFGLSVSAVRQGMGREERKQAYLSDIVYASANEVGFDYLRDQLALYAGEQVHRDFGAAVIDEADSLLIDEARIPLVIAGGKTDAGALAIGADQVVRQLRNGFHYTIDGGAHNVALTDAGIRVIEESFACKNLFETTSLPLLTAVQDALHAHGLLRRDVDYIVKNESIELVDEFKGRVALDRRWPAGVHAAVEAKEGVAAKMQGMVLSSITLQNLMALYPKICGMTGTAQTQSIEFRKMYGLEVEPIPTNRPMIRVDEPVRVYRTRAEKYAEVLREIRCAHQSGQPVLVGTGSVAESEELSRMLAGVPHEVLNARNDEQEAAIIAKAGEREAVTISTNMAGRGTDIRLGPGVAGLGGLLVIGTNLHDSRRIGNQLRGRAGRQGDPGRSMFLVSLEDPFMEKYRDVNPKYREDPESVQRLVEGQHLDTRLFLHSYEVPVEGLRNKVQEHRQAVLEGSDMPERDRLITLRAIDDLWADHLARVADYKSGVQWLSWGRQNPFHEYMVHVHQWSEEWDEALEEEVARRIALADAGEWPDPGERGAVWTYLTKDEPFGNWTERLIRGLRRKLAGGE